MHLDGQMNIQKVCVEDTHPDQDFLPVGQKPRLVIGVANGNQ